MTSLLKRLVAVCCASCNRAMPLRGEIQELVELVATKRMTFRRALDLDEAGPPEFITTFIVGLGAGILGNSRGRARERRGSAHGDGGTWP